MLPLWTIAEMLTSKAELLVAGAIRRGRSMEQIAKSVFARFQRATDSQLDTLFRFALEGIEAGNYLTSLAREESFDVERIPHNPYLWGGDSAGRRFLMANDISIGSDFETFEVRLDLPDFFNLDDLYTQIDLEVENRAQRSPRNPFMVAVAEALESNTIITFAERAW